MDVNARFCAFMRVFNKCKFRQRNSVGPTPEPVSERPDWSDLYPRRSSSLRVNRRQVLVLQLTESALIPMARIYMFAGVKNLTEYLWFEVPNRRGFVNITSTVEDLVSKSGVKEGICLVNAMHISASVFINDAEEGLLHDYEVWLEKLAPHAPVSQYQHNRTGEDNADAHLKRQVMGREVVIAVTKGKLDFGPWEQIFYGEFDGRRKKRVLVKIIGE